MSTMAKRNQLLQTFLENTALELAIVDSSDEESEIRIWDELEENAATFVGLRYSFRSNVPKNLDWYDEVLPDLDDKRFKVMMRVSRVQFNVILALIENHEVFNGRNSEKQFTTQFQLALVLYRLGSFGDGSTLAKIAALFGIGDGGTIEKITTRVFNSIVSLEKRFITWPNEAERNQLITDTFDELPNCFGYLDGTEIPLQERPIFDHESYYSRNKQYSIKAQAICDYNLQIRQLTVGYPGSAHDARIYNNCKLATHPQNFFTGPQYIAADSAYRLLTSVMTPFRRNATDLTPRSRANYNKYFSSYRVRIEHFFGILKQIFSSLQCLNIRIKDVKSHKFVCTWVQVCCILYNVLRPHFEECDLDYNIDTINQGGFNGEEDDIEEGENEDLDEMAKCKRIALVRFLAEK